MKGPEYEEMLRAGLLTPTGFADAVAMAFTRTLTEAMDEHVAASVKAGRDPRVRDEAWALIAPQLGMTRSTLSATIFGRRDPTLLEADRLHSHPQLGARYQGHLHVALGSI